MDRGGVPGAVSRTLRAFHAGRPVDPDAYRRHGLLLASPERLIAEAYEVFAGEEETLTALLPRQDLSLIDGRVDLHLDERFLLEKFTFYSLYGSHFLLGLACQLERATGRPMRERLRQRGVPTIAVCDVPVDRLSPKIRRQLPSALLALESSEVSDFGFSLDRPLPRSRVVACHHPRGLPDFL